MEAGEGASFITSFLIGAARSGTKFLRNCFSVSDEIEIVPYDIGYVWRYGNEKISHDELKPSDLDNKLKFWIRKYQMMKMMMLIIFLKSKEVDNTSSKISFPMKSKINPSQNLVDLAAKSRSHSMHSPR